MRQKRHTFYFIIIGLLHIFIFDPPEEKLSKKVVQNLSSSSFNISRNSQGKHMWNPYKQILHNVSPLYDLSSTNLYNNSELTSENQTLLIQLGKVTDMSALCNMLFLLNIYILAYYLLLLCLIKDYFDSLSTETKSVVIKRYVSNACKWLNINTNFCISSGITDTNSTSNKNIDNNSVYEYADMKNSKDWIGHFLYEPSYLIPTSTTRQYFVYPVFDVSRLASYHQLPEDTKNANSVSVVRVSAAGFRVHKKETLVVKCDECEEEQNLTDLTSDPTHPRYHSPKGCSYANQDNDMDGTLLNGPLKHWSLVSNYSDTCKETDSVVESNIECDAAMCSNSNTSNTALSTHTPSSSNEGASSLSFPSKFY